mgnify:CR=1 FL=1
MLALNLKACFACHSFYPQPKDYRYHFRFGHIIRLGRGANADQCCFLQVGMETRIGFAERSRAYHAIGISLELISESAFVTSISCWTSRRMIRQYASMFK